jgi:hypothetical protein
LIRSSQRRNTCAGRPAQGQKEGYAQNRLSSETSFARLFMVRFFHVACFNFLMFCWQRQ